MLTTLFRGRFLTILEFQSGNESKKEGTEDSYSFPTDTGSVFVIQKRHRLLIWTIAAVIKMDIVAGRSPSVFDLSSSPLPLLFLFLRLRSHRSALHSHANRDSVIEIQGKMFDGLIDHRHLFFGIETFHCARVTDGLPLRPCEFSYLLNLPSSQ